MELQRLKKIFILSDDRKKFILIERALSSPETDIMTKLTNTVQTLNSNRYLSWNVWHFHHITKPSCVNYCACCLSYTSGHMMFVLHTHLIRLTSKYKSNSLVWLQGCKYLFMSFTIQLNLNWWKGKPLGSIACTRKHLDDKKNIAKRNKWWR